MIDTKSKVWLSNFSEAVINAAINANFDEQYVCNNGHRFLFPDIMHPDAGGIFDAGIVGKHKIEPMAVCPECRIRIRIRA